MEASNEMLQRLLQVFNKIDSLASSEREPSENYILFMGRCFDAVDASSVSRLVQYKTKLIDVATALNKENDDNVSDICMKLNYLQTVLRDYYTNWGSTLTLYEGCKCCADVWGVQKNTVDSRHKVAKISMSYFDRVFGPSDFMAPTKGPFESVWISDGQPCIRVGDVSNLASSCMSSAEQYFPEWFELRGGMSSALMLALHPNDIEWLSAKTLEPRIRDLSSTQRVRAGIIKAFLSNHVTSNTVLVILPQATEPGIVRHTLMGKSRSTALKVFKPAPRDKNEQVFFERGTSCLSELVGSVGVRDAQNHVFCNIVFV